MRKIVFSGGTHCGKTTLVEYYRDLGYYTVSEPGMTFISELVKEMGLEKYKFWREKNQQEFFNRLIERQIQLESLIPDNSNFVFFDRSIFDTIAMCEHVGVQVPKRAEEYAQDCHYDDVFICDPLPYFENRDTTGRVFTKEDSEKIARNVQKKYDEYSYSPIHLPPIPVRKRIELINKKIGLAGPRDE